MEKNGKMPNVLKALDIFFDSLTFVSIQYLLLCCSYSFRESIVYVFFFALDVSVICKFWINLKSVISNKILLFTVFILNFIVLAAFMLMFGYLEISPVLKEIS